MPVEVLDWPLASANNSFENSRQALLFDGKVTDG